MTESVSAHPSREKFSSRNSKEQDLIANERQKLGEQKLNKLEKDLIESNLLLRLKLIVNESIKLTRKPAIELGIPPSLEDAQRQVKILFEPEVIMRKKDKLKPVEFSGYSSREGAVKKYRSRQVRICFDKNNNPEVQYAARVEKTREADINSLVKINDGDWETVQRKNVSYLSTSWLPISTHKSYVSFLSEQEREPTFEEQVRMAIKRTSFRFDERRMGKDGLEGSSEHRIITKRLH